MTHAYDPLSPTHNLNIHNYRNVKCIDTWVHTNAFVGALVRCVRVRFDSGSQVVPIYTRMSNIPTFSFHVFSFFFHTFPSLFLFLRSCYHLRCIPFLLALIILRPVHLSVFCLLHSHIPHLHSHRLGGSKKEREREREREREKALFPSVNSNQDLSDVC